jgi:hypothetical protein
MGPRRFLTATSLAAALLLGAVCSSLPAQAAGPRPAVRCDALVGFNGTVREDRFAPVILTVENPGARLRARVSLEVTWGPLRGAPPGRTIIRDAVLDAGSTRRFSFVIPVPRNVQNLRATVTSGGVLVGGMEMAVRPLTTASRLIAGISSDLSLDNLSALGGSAGALRVVYPRVDDLPQSWAGYDGVDAVVVHDTSFQQLRSDQVAALERWVVTGGVLVFTGGAAALQHEPAGFGPLLPVRVSGLAQRPGLAAIPVGGERPRRLPGRVEVAVSRVTTGRLVTSDGDLPLVVQRRLGRGSIWFLAFDPTEAPVSSWDGALSLWRGILDGDRLPTLGNAPRPATEDPVIAGMLAASAVSFPPVPAVLLFVGAYLLLLVPLLVSRPGSRMRARLRILLLAGAVAAASGAAWLLFNRVLFHPGLQVIDAGRVEARSDDGLAVVTEKVGYFATSARQVEARIGSADAALEAAAFRSPPEAPLSDAHLVLTQAGARAVISGMQVERLGERLLVAQDVVPFDVSVRVTTAGSSLDAVVRNGNSRPLLGCFILVSGRAYPLGDVAAGASVRRTYAAADGLGSASDGAADTDGRRAALFKAWSEEEGPGGRSAQLVAWMDGPVLSLSVVGARPVGGRPGVALVTVDAE